MKFNEYAEHPATNQSKLKKLGLESPKHYKHDVENQKPSTESQIAGRYLHTLALEPDKVDEDYAIWSTGTRKGDKWNEFCKQAADEGKDVLSVSTVAQKRDHEYTKQAAAAVQAHPAVAKAIAAGETERSYIGHDVETGKLIKCRADLVTPNDWYDLKGVNTTDNRAFNKLAFNNGWYHQAAYNRRCIIAAGEPEPATYKHIVVETKPPFDVAVYTIPSDTLDAADKEITAWLLRLIECEEKDEWPGRQPVEDSGELSEVPSYAFAFDVDDFTFADGE